MTEPIKEIADARERSAALDPARSFIVQAPAGSGKTELLMQRFLALLSCVKRPEELMAMTFTRKAAAGMRNRIVDALRAAAEGTEPVLPNERVTFALAASALERSASLGWALLANPGRLKIQTIDAFCASVARAAPVLSKTGGRLAISGNPKELYLEAAARTVEMLDGGGQDAQVVMAALRHMDNSVEALTDRVVVMLARRDQWLRHIKDVSFDDDLRSELEGAVGRLVEARLIRVCETFPYELDDWLLASARFAASNLGEESPVKSLANLSAMPGASRDDLCLWRSLAALLLTDKGELRKAKGINKNNGFPADAAAAKDKRLFKDLLAEFEPKDEFLRELAQVKGLPVPRYDDGEWEILLALARLLPVAVGCLKDVFTMRGEADFVEYASAAIEALGSADAPTDTLLALDLRLAHILVDEYQDTSYTQLELLRLLTSGWEPGDGRTLFVVGDPMQSIFLWREAQVGLFLEARRSGINDIRLEPLTLRTNFRSHAQIIDWVNAAFGPVFPAAEDVFTGAVRYEPSVAYKEALAKGEPVLRLFDGRSDEAEAGSVVSILNGIGKDESCAVLCRSRTHLSAIVEALKAEGLAFRARDFDPLSERVVIQDLLALLRFLLHPYDRTAGLAILRAPWCGLALVDLHRLCLGDALSPVWTLINDEARLATLSEDGRERIALVRPKLAGALVNQGRVPMRSLLEGLWIGLGGPACLADASAMTDAGAFFDVVGSVSVGGRLDPLKSIEGRLEKLYADYGGIDTNIELMTLHKAKGLEFDHVLMPGLGRPPRGDDKKLLIWMERGDDILLAPVEKRRGGVPSPLYDYLTGVTKEKTRLEAVRLFYVGATRARRRLYLFGHTKPGPELRVEKESFLGLVPRLLESVVNDADRSVPSGVEAAPSLVRLKRLSSAWTLPQAADAVDTAAEMPEAAGRVAPEFRWAGQAAKQMGKAVHQYLCRIANEGAADWTPQRVRDSEGHIMEMLRSSGVTGDEAAQRAAIGVETICKALSDERGRWLIGPHKEAATEFAITAVINGAIEHLRIDRTFVDEAGVRWVVDYKTGGHEGGSLDEFLKSEKERYRPQLERYVAAIRATGTACEIRRGLYYPALGEWIEWGDVE